MGTVWVTDDIAAAALWFMPERRELPAVWVMVREPVRPL